MPNHQFSQDSRTVTVSPPPHDHSPPYELLRAHLQVRVPLTDADFTTFWGYLRPLALRKRQHLFQSGEVCNYYAFVTQGCLRSYSLMRKGHEHTLAQFASEDWWISGGYVVQPAYLTAQHDEHRCAGRSQLLLLDQADLETIYAQFPFLTGYSGC